MTAWSPLRRPVFRALWAANLVSNIGGWMQNLTAVWVMATLTSSSLMIALVQTAISLPVFLVGLQAGALADLVDRRRLLIATQMLQLAAAAAITAMSYTGHLNIAGLLGCTFVLGLGAALNNPAWLAITHELVGAEELPRGVALNGISINIARAVGPALAGVLLAFYKPWMIFFANALSFLVVVVVLIAWRRKPQEYSSGYREPMLKAVVGGLRYVSHSAPIKAVIVRVALFVIGASAYWALLPLVAFQRLHLGAGGYGALLAACGLGAVIGASSLPKIRGRLSLDATLVLATTIYASASFLLAWTPNMAFALVVNVLIGFAWITQMTSFNVATQRTAARWVQARALALYLFTFQGGLAAGSAVWGGLAESYGASWAMTWGSIALVFSLLSGVLWRLAPNENLDLTATRHWPRPTTVSTPEPGDGPVLLVLEYTIDPAEVGAFRACMDEVRQVRCRDGAYAWGLYSDTSRPERKLETFLFATWADHIRQHERVSVADLDLEKRLLAFQQGPNPIRVRHYLTD
jgi:MFS family permease